MQQDATDHRVRWADPPRAFGPFAFWFWNDALEERELLRQVREFHAKGFGGFVPHPRTGLAHGIGYLTKRYFELLKVCVAEAARLQMKVVLYDEACYPSGSAQGRVVAEDPAYAARCIVPVTAIIDGPASGYWRPNSGRALLDRLLSVVALPQGDGGQLDLAAAKTLVVNEQGLAHYQLPEGRWRLVATFDVPSGGTIRGVFEEEEDRHATAPPAGDIMNPQAVACFIRLTHDAYYASLKPYFGKTIVAMFTDEPCPLGRHPRRGPDPRPYSPGLLEEWEEACGHPAEGVLPALWFDCGEPTESLRKTYERCVRRRIDRVFYGAQSRWCDEHGIALTGHPERSDDLTALGSFHWPGQDLVWRWVLPASPSAREGPHSVVAKVASSAAVLHGRERNVTELFGAYGWRLNFDEIKWLLDWHLVRGTDLFFLHACFYSIRGRRAYESEPDLGVHNVWWKHFGLFGTYLRRLCWTMVGAKHQCAVGVIVDGDEVSSTAAAHLLANQTDFVFLDTAALLRAESSDGGLTVSGHHFKVLVRDAPGGLEPAAEPRLNEIRSSGCAVVNTAEEAIAHLRNAGSDLVRWTGESDLRVRSYRNAGRQFIFLVNEGERPLAGELELSGARTWEAWNALSGDVARLPTRMQAGSTRATLRLDRRESLLLVESDGTNDTSQLEVGAGCQVVVRGLAAGWAVTRGDGSAVGVTFGSDWSRLTGYELFAGSLVYRTVVELTSADVDGGLVLDLGRVGDIAHVRWNEQDVGILGWAPYRIHLRGHPVVGRNALTIEITNSMANRFEGDQFPSGLIGPVVLRRP